MNGRPLDHQAHGSWRQSAGDHSEQFDADEGFVLSVSRVEMRRRVVIEEQLDDDAVEAAELNLAGLQVRKHVLWRLSRKLQIKRVRAEVQTGTPADRAILGEMNVFEGAGAVPGLEDPSTCEM